MADRLLVLEKIRDLIVEAPFQEGRPSFVGAASGLIEFQGAWLVISDDDHAIAEFRDGEPGRYRQILEGELPLEPKARKKLKPDFEALSLIGASLLAIPSGSKPNRCRGVIIAETSRVVDFAPLYSKLSKELGELNVEGGVACGASFWLLNRGNSADGRNALVVTNLAKLTAELQKGEISGFERILPLELGSIDGVPLCFTDACPDGEGGALFLAAAEGTTNTYDDGRYLGAALGKLSSKGRVEWVKPLACPHKPEGIWPGRTGHVRIVTDSDDHQIPASMYEVRL